MVVMNCERLKRADGGLWIVLSLVSLILSSLLMACSSQGISCDFDSDCNHGDLCVESLCAHPCTSDQQCEGEGTCQAFVRQNEDDQVHVCMVVSDENDAIGGEFQCVNDGECRALLGVEEAICGLNYRCVVPEPDSEAGVEQVSALLIRDLTPRVLVEEEGHPGTIVNAVFVRDENGSIVGYGDTLALVSGTDGMEQSGHLDGQPVQLEESGQCVAGAEPAMSALGGEGGYYLVSFVDSQGARISPGEGWKVIVIAWSESCGGAGEPQPALGEYRVSLCVSVVNQVPDLDSDCSPLGAQASGYAEFLVTTEL